MVEDWSKARWFVVFAGIADAWLWSFDADGRWRLRHDNPAMGSLAVLPMDPDGRLADLQDVIWLADCIAFDHDAPVGVRPTASNSDARFPYEPIHQFPSGMPEALYFDNVNEAFSAAAGTRFGDSYCLRYFVGDSNAPRTDFEARFVGREQLVALYAMAARQADILSEYLCLYRVIEAADGGNGKSFVVSHLGELRNHDFGELRVMELVPTKWTDAFAVYRQRAVAGLDRLRSEGCESPDAVASRLYDIRNSLAHGKTSVRVGDYGTGVTETASALSIVKLLARLAVEP